MINDAYSDNSIDASTGCTRLDVQEEVSKVIFSVYI